jgi:hypothetical protein
VSHVRRVLSTAILVGVLALPAGNAAARKEAADHGCAKRAGITFRAADGLKLHGHRFGRGKTAVVFAHEARAVFASGPRTHVSWPDAAT